MKPNLKTGRNSEEDARWQLNREFSTAKNWRVLHNLVVPDHRSATPCQIDHLLIGRLCDIIVCETKSAVNRIHLDGKTGAWSTYHNGERTPIASPIEQNARHIEVLAHHLKASELFPKRSGFPIVPRLHNWILVQPGASLPLVYNNAWVVQRDQIGRRFRKYELAIGATDVLRIIGFEELEHVTECLRQFQVNSVQTPPSVTPAFPAHPQAQIPGSTYKPER